jgi:uncharacterized protein YqgC (DUF456 family)
LVEILGWILVVVLFAVGMAGAVFPVLPGVLAIYAAFFVYGFFFGFEPFGFWFWFIQTTMVLIIFVADYLVSAWGTRRFGGSRASVIGSTVGLIFGPFVIPVLGLIIGPFLGAVIGEMIAGGAWRQSVQVGLGAVVGLFSSMAAKIILQLGMIILFVIWIV